MSLLQQLRTAARKRAAYRRTLYELQGVPATWPRTWASTRRRARLARTAVYG
jgi:hypothetical protein